MIDKIALALVVIGGLNWGSIGLFGFDFVGAIFGGQDAVFSRIIFSTLEHLSFFSEKRSGGHKGLTNSCGGGFKRNRRRIFYGNRLYSRLLLRYDKGKAGRFPPAGRKDGFVWKTQSSKTPVSTTLRCMHRILTGQ